jgi:hypothetical protein
MSAQATLICPYYRQPNMLRKQLETWCQYPEHVKDAFHFTVVDDCSLEAAEDVMLEDLKYVLPNLSLYRIERDIPWNRGMARNLGTKMAETSWILHVDTDHVLPVDFAKQLIKLLPKMDGKTWYRFARTRIGKADETRKKDRVDPNLEVAPIHPHIDSYLCTQKQYWKAGGYNEDFSGVLGGGSPFLKEMVKANGEPEVLDSVRLHVHTRHSVPDSSENTLSRDPAAFKKRKEEIMRKRGTLKGHDPIRLPWHKVF